MNCKTHIEPPGPVYVYDGLLEAGQRSVALKAIVLFCQTNQLTLKKAKHLSVPSTFTRARFESLPRSNAHARLRPYTVKYGRRDCILPYFHVIPGSVLRSYFSVSFTEGYDHFRVQVKFVFTTSLHTIAVRFVRNRSYTEFVIVDLGSVPAH